MHSVLGIPLSDTQTNAVNYISTSQAVVAHRFSKFVLKYDAKKVKHEVISLSLCSTICAPFSRLT